MRPHYAALPLYVCCVCVAFAKVHLGPYALSNDDWAAVESTLACWANASTAHWLRHKGPRLLWDDATDCLTKAIGLRYAVECGPVSARTLPLSYVWTPSGCAIRPPGWSRSLLRRMLCGRSRRDVMVVGDSLSEEFAITLRLALGTCGTEVECPDGVSARIHTVRNDHLDMANHNVGINGRPFYERLVRDHRVGTVVFNRGAHYVADGPLLADLARLFTALRSARPDVLVVFRNTAGGHWACLNSSTIVDGPVLHYEGSPMNIMPPRDPFRWLEFVRQNLHIQRLIHTHFPGIIYLDVAQATALRRDSHCHAADCLHYCIPGPVDYWVEAFMQALWLVRRHAGLAD